MIRESDSKYSEAVSLYSSTRLSIKDICERTGTPVVGFSNYLCRHHRNLILQRHDLNGLDEVKLRGTKGQTTAAYLKYRDAIAAADSPEYIEYNISQIARIFGLDGTCLANQLRRHYPEILPRREKERHRLRVNDNIHRGVRPWCVEGYSRAIEMLKTSDITVMKAAAECGVPYSGLREHLSAYHKDLISLREEKRVEVMTMRAERKREQKEIRSSRAKPCRKTSEKYAEALKLYATTSESIRSIANSLGLGYNAFCSYLRRNFPELTERHKAIRHSLPK